MSADLAQVTPHHAERIELPSKYGPMVALHARAAAAPFRVLMVPGYTGSKEDFAPLLDPLAAAGFDVLAVDLPGQYESPGSDREADYLPEPLGELVAEQVRALALESRVVLVGHSYGGLVARAAVLGGCPVAGLVLLDSGPAALPSEARLAVMDSGEPVLRAEGVTAAWAVRLAALQRNPRYSAVPRRLAEFQQRRFVSSTAAGLLGMADGLRHEHDRVPRLRRALARLDAPCLVACGENDDAWPPALQRHMAERLEADFAMLPGAGHSPNTENPAALLDTLTATWHSWARAPGTQNHQ